MKILNLALSFIVLILLRVIMAWAPQISISSVLWRLSFPLVLIMFIGGMANTCIGLRIRGKLLFLALDLVARVLPWLHTKRTRAMARKLHGLLVRIQAFLLMRAITLSGRI